MPKQKSILNAKVYIENVVELFELYKTYGDCPLFQGELPKFSLIGRAILRKAEERRKTGNRKDIAL